MTRIYQAINQPVGSVIELSQAASHHVAKVLRMSEGQRLCIFDGANNEFIAIIKHLTKKTVTVELIEKQSVCRESPVRIHLFQAVSKGERMEFVVQKAVELGVAAITPVISERCVVKLNKERWQKKHDQWQAIAVSACEQCGRNQIPEIHQVQHFDDVIASIDGNAIILNPKGEMRLVDIDVAIESFAALIGPEGGFSQAELEQAAQANIQSISLGPRILRTETAALAVLALIQGKFGDL